MSLTFDSLAEVHTFMKEQAAAFGYEIHLIPVKKDESASESQPASPENGESSES